MTIIEFLAARLDEDEAAAKAWLPIGNPDEAARNHIARHDPARVLAEVEAKRGVIAKCEAALKGSARSGEEMMRTLAVLVLEDLVSAYANHPDYQDDWRR